MRKEIQEPAYPVITSAEGKPYQKPGISLRQLLGKDILCSLLSNTTFLAEHSYQEIITDTLIITNAFLEQEEETR